MPASVARVLGAGVAERRTPPTVGCRTRETERGCVPGLPANGTRDGQDEEDAARPGSTRWRKRRVENCCRVERPAWELVTGRRGERRRNSARVNSREPTRGSCCYVGDEEDAARPRVIRCGTTWEAAREAASQLAMADRRVVKLRPVPQEPCRRREEPASVQGALRPGCPRGRSERRSNRCECVLRGGLRESEAQSFRSDPWAAVRRARLNPMQPIPDSGDGNPPGF